MDYTRDQETIRFGGVSARGGAGGPEPEEDEEEPFGAGGPEPDETFEDIIYFAYRRFCTDDSLKGYFTDVDVREFKGHNARNPVTDGKTYNERMGILRDFVSGDIEDPLEIIDLSESKWMELFTGIHNLSIVSRFGNKRIIRKYRKFIINLFLKGYKRKIYFDSIEYYRRSRMFVLTDQQKIKKIKRGETTQLCDDHIYCQHLTQCEDCTRLMCGKYVHSERYCPECRSKHVFPLFY
jgi:hypothetical protein